MTLSQRIEAFKKLYEALLHLPAEQRAAWAAEARVHNGWFDEASVEAALRGVVQLLEPGRLQSWLHAASPAEPAHPLQVGVVAAGNIPLAVFHDWLMVLLSGHIFLGKLSAQDPVLLKKINGLLATISPELAARSVFAEQLKAADAFIATGSDNSARYFHYYFSKKPSIIRHNRTSCSVLAGTETDEVLAVLSEDVLRYYGLGCRNISKIWLPEGFDLTRLCHALEPASRQAILNNKYVNNYDYQKAILLVNRIEHYDTGGLLFRQSEELVSPVAVVYYDYYRQTEEVETWLAARREHIQCVVSEAGRWPGSVPIGQAQYPAITDFADGVDTLAFLSSLSHSSLQG